MSPPAAVTHAAQVGDTMNAGRIHTRIRDVLVPWVAAKEESKTSPGTFSERIGSAESYTEGR